MLIIKTVVSVYLQKRKFILTFPYTYITTEGSPLLEKIYTLAILCLTTIYLGHNDKRVNGYEGLKIEHKYELFISLA